MSDRLDQLDYYALFSIEPGASADAIRAAFHAFARRYHPDRFAAAPEAKRERAEAIYRRGAEAYRVLMSGESRRRYDEGLARGELRLSAAATDPKRPSSTTRLTVTSPRARPFATKAQEAW
jgi:curved DNA-binding protein CbpA